jgi:hypothetical protein
LECATRFIKFAPVGKLLKESSSSPMDPFLGRQAVSYRQFRLLGTVTTSPLEIDYGETSVGMGSTPFLISPDLGDNMLSTRKTKAWIKQHHCRQLQIVAR